MRATIHFVTATALLVVVSAVHICAQTSPDVWRRFAERVDVGTELTLRLNDGRRFRATLIDVRDDAVLVQPKTRIPVPIQAVPYDAILSMERRKDGHGGPAKVVAVGVATGVGVVFVIMAVLAAAIGD